MNNRSKTFFVYDVQNRYIFKKASFYYASTYLEHVALPRISHGQTMSEKMQNIYLDLKYVFKSYFDAIFYDW